MAGLAAAFRRLLLLSEQTISIATGRGESLSYCNALPASSLSVQSGLFQSPLVTTWLTDAKRTL